MNIAVSNARNRRIEHFVRAVELCSAYEGPANDTRFSLLNMLESSLEDSRALQP